MLLGLKKFLKDFIAIGLINLDNTLD